MGWIKPPVSPHRIPLTLLSVSCSRGVIVPLSAPVRSHLWPGSVDCHRFDPLHQLSLSPAFAPTLTEVLWLSRQEGEMFYCSHITPPLTSDDSTLPSLQNSVPWDPSAPPLKGTSDTSGNQERIKCSVSTSVSEKRECWRKEAMPQAPTGMFKPWKYVTNRHLKA